MKTPGKEHIGRYNVTLSKLMELVVRLSEEEQVMLLEKAEELVRLKGAKPKRTSLRQGKFQNERRYPRKPCTIIVNFSAGSRYYTSSIQNISVDGAFIHTRAAFEIGEAVSMAFSYPDFPDVFRIRGRICRVTPRGIGVQFQGLSPPQRNRINALLEWIKGHAI